MKKSEKILLSLVAVAGLYGLIDFSFRSLSKAPPTTLQTTGAENQLETISTQLNALSQSENIDLASLIDEIQKPWRADIFYTKTIDSAPSPTPVETKQADKNIELLQTAAQSLTYSGFLTMGESTIAIIDGLDYQVNESVNGFTITGISPKSVYLKKDGMQFTVPASHEASSGRYTHSETLPKPAFNEALATPDTNVSPPPQ